MNDESSDCLKPDDAEYDVVTPGEVAALVTRVVGATHGDSTLLLDVRTPREYAQYRIPGAALLPVQDLPDRWHELDPHRPIICICEHGVRSERAAEFLADRAFRRVATMCGGMVRWTGPIEHGMAEVAKAAVES